MNEIKYIPPLHLLDDLILAAEIKKYNNQAFTFFDNGYYYMSNILPFIVVLDEMGYYVQGFTNPPAPAPLVEVNPIQTESFILMCGNEVFNYSEKPQKNIFIETSNILAEKEKIKAFPPFIKKEIFNIWNNLYQAIKNKSSSETLLYHLSVYFEHELLLKSLIKESIISFIFAPYEVALHFNNQEIINYYLNHFSNEDLLKSTNHYLLFHKEKSKQLYNTDFYDMCDYLSHVNLISFETHFNCFNMPEDKKIEIMSLYEKNKLEKQLSNKIVIKTQKI
jgi:hypothetical protein